MLESGFYVWEILAYDNQDKVRIRMKSSGVFLLNEASIKKNSKSSEVQSH